MTGRRDGAARALVILLGAACALGADGPPPRVATNARIEIPDFSKVGSIPSPAPARVGGDAPRRAPSAGVMAAPKAEDILKTATPVVLYALAAVAPAAVLMLTAFVRISIVLNLLRQALGSPQIPGNQVLMALALMLTALVMRPVADRVYSDAIDPYLHDRATPKQAWEAGSKPIKTFMIRQVYATHHERYLRDLYDYSEPPGPSRVEPTDPEQLSLRVVAPAYLLSELSTALVIGFSIYLPFLVIDLVVSAVLAAMGLVMLPPSQVALPLKLIAFVLADGWWLVPSMLLKSFGPVG